MSLLQIHEPGQTPEPHAHKDGVPAIGIDLGTTHSVVALMVGDRPQVLRNIAGKALIPSVVAYGKDNSSEAVVGSHALACSSAIHSIKRCMHEASKMLDTSAGPKTPVEISAEILRVCKTRASKMLGEEVNKAVITVPAYFDDAARTATRDAARLAGLEVLRLVNEPTAAALAYGLDTGAEGIYAVYDLGGGTFDISILRLERGVFQVLATGGDTQLGGDDIDAAVVELLDGKVSLQEARVIKERLSEEEVVCSASVAKQSRATPVEHESLDCRVDLTASSQNGIMRAQFEHAITPLITRTLTICEQALRDAVVEKDAIKGTVMVGGSTRIPLVQQMVGDLFKTKILTDVNPDEVVAQGAALQAHALTVGSDNLLLDVTPLSLGLETMGGIVEKVIERNTPIPVSMAQEFTTYEDGQSAMKIHVVQGEREKTEDCRSLAHFTLKGIPPMIAGAARIKVHFTVDADGLLTVSAREETTNVQQVVEVKPTYGIDVGTMAQMLDDSMKHAQEDILARLLIEARVEAQRVINEVESAIKHDGHLLQDKEAQQIAMQIERVSKAIESDNRDLIDSEAQLLNHLTNPFAQRRMDNAIGDALKGQKIEDVG